MNDEKRVVLFQLEFKGQYEGLVYLVVFQVNVSSLNPEHAYIQITHVEPYFTPKDLERRKVKFERENNISRFVYETPFTVDGKTHGDVTKHCMRKTILTSE